MNSVALKENIQPRSNDDLWNDEQTATLVRMWTVEGKTGSEIGRHVNKTRNAVIAKVHRMKLKRLDETPEVPPAPVAVEPPTVAEVIPLDRPPVKEEPQAAGGLPLPPMTPPPAPITPIPDVIGDEAPTDDDEDGDEDKDDRGGYTIPLNEAAPVAAPKVEATPAPEPEPEPKVQAPVAFKASPIESAFPVEVVEPATDLPAGPKPGQNVAVSSALRASDGGEGTLLLRAGSFECKFPLWADNTPIDKKRVCGCKVVTGKSWCKTHFAVVFEPPRKR